jgi:mRNA-degrading endonuclease RelE of RelBE toxin-antitoxin system
MNLKIISLGSFAKDVKKLYKKYKGIVKDLQKLEDELQKDPKCGIHLGNSCYKIRLKNSSIPTGKSGGFRVIYYYVDEEKNLYLMAMYSKSELENVSDEKILNILKAYDL